MSKKPALHPEYHIARALQHVALDILEDARTALNHRSKSDASVIHDYRKAQKRWRALLRLLGPFLGERGRQLRTEARDLARELAGPRDAQSALDALKDLMKEQDAKDVLSSENVRAMTARLEKSKASKEARRLTAGRRERLSAALDRAATAVTTWPIDKLTFREIVDRMTAGYGRARKLQPDDWTSAEPEALHALRQKVVAHRYHMELVEPLWPKLGRTWIDGAQRLRSRLGRCQDLTVLTALARPRQILSPWRTQLLPLIERRKVCHVKSARRAARRLFAATPKKFRKQMEALWAASSGDK